MDETGTGAVSPGGPQQTDLDQLRIVEIFHYVVAGLVGLFSLIPVIHLVIGILAVRGELEPGGGPQRLFGWFFIGMASALILSGLTMAALLVVAGRNLARRRRWTFCLAVACVACLFMPFGTVLGIFTILLLVRPSVRAAFDGGRGGAFPPG